MTLTQTRLIYSNNKLPYNVEIKHIRTNFPYQEIADKFFANLLCCDRLLSISKLMYASPVRLAKKHTSKQ